MKAESKCRDCGTTIPSDSVGGYCPQCLLNLGLQAAAPPMEAESAATENPGDRIGRYRLLQEIGHGGCGVVYMAEQEAPVRRKVALKVIKLGMDTRQVVARFEAERQALALMDHPNIAKILDAGVTGVPLTPSLSPSGGEGDRRSGEGGARYPRPSAGRGAGGEGLSAGRPYFVMELEGGIRITDYCDQNNLTTRQRLDLFIQVCRAIQHAHQKGIIHRDIKPSNVLVATQDGVPVSRVIDFGIAKATQGRLTDQTLFTAFEQFLGTPAYMSPEQTQLGSLDVDTRSDIYSLGVLLYELLTGTTPFDTKELAAAGLDEMRRAIREVEPVRPSTRLTRELERRGSAGVPPAESGVAPDSRSPNQNPSGEKQMREVSGGTPKTAHETRALPEKTKELIHQLRGDLDWIVMKCLEKDRSRRYETANGLARDIERHLTNEPVVARPPSKFYEFQKTVRRHKFGFAATAAVIVVLAIGATLSTWQAVRATRAEREQSRLRKEAQDNLWSAHLSEARALRLSGQSGRHFDSLAALRKAAAIRPSLELRNEAIACLMLQDLQWLGAKDFTETRQSVSLDPSFERYAVCEPSGIVTIRRVAGDGVVARLVAEGRVAVTVEAFSPNGEHLPVGYADGGWRVWNWAASASTVLVESLKSVGFTPDSRSVGVSDGRNITLYDLESGVRLLQIPLNGLGSPRAPGSLEFAPSGERLALFNTEVGTNVQILDIHTGRTLATLQHPDFVFHLAWHPDGRRLAAGCADGTIRIWDALSGERLQTWPNESSVRVRFDRAGGMLASSGWDGFTRLWDFDRGRQLGSIQKSGHLWGFDPDGSRLALGGWEGTMLGFLAVARGQCLRTLYEAPVALSGGGGKPVMDTKGHFVAFGTQEGIGLWEVRSARAVGSAALDENRSLIGFDADSRNLILTGSEGLFRCPISESDAGEPRRLGEAILVSTECADPTGPRMGWVSADGRTCVIVGNNRGQVFRTDTFEKQAETDLQPGMRFGSINANGSMFASGAWHFGGVRVWDARTGELIKKLLAEEEGENTATTVAFTPDGRELVTATPSGYSFWEIGSWSLIRHVPPPPGGTWLTRMALSRDGSLFAAANSQSRIQLHDAATGKVLADFAAPNPKEITGLVFSQDGSQLFVSETADALRVWDLRLIRRQLAELGLEWDRPPNPARDAATGVKSN